MIEFSSEKHLVSDNNCNIVTLVSFFKWMTNDVKSAFSVGDPTHAV